jgi:hypothetical protein
MRYARPQLACVSSAALQCSYSEATACMRQLMCTTAVSQLRSDQLVPLHQHAHYFMYPTCMSFFSIFLFFMYPTWYKCQVPGTTKYLIVRLVT